MSTFDGIVKEFPDIRIDYFRPSAEASRPPLAYFLSHIHTDHTVGLETCKSPFVYCSPATREILLRLQKFPHRMNFARGIVEKHEQHFKHLKKLLKPIPLETPTTIELSPGNTIRVTLFDANHCVGAVCFLVEGGGKAVFYTGDIRAESWWVNTLCRHPLLVPYLPSTGLLRAPLKRLDCVYLDTTFAVKEDVYKQFPSKASGIAELLLSVSKYPKGTLFYFDSWTFGVDFVRITPIISRHNSKEIREVGAGGGHVDLDTHNELVVGDAVATGQLIALCALRLQSQPQVLASVMELLTGFISKQISSVSLDGSGFVEDCLRAVNGDDLVNADELPLERLVPALAKLVTKAEPGKASPSANSPNTVLKRPDGLAKQITFPYSRHSSYEELCDLIDAFKPKDIYPCTIDDANWTTDQSISFLFGHVYTSGHQFTHDQVMLTKRGLRRPSTNATPRALSPASSEQGPKEVPHSTQRPGEHEHQLARRSNEATGHRADDFLVQDQGCGKVWQPQRQADHDSPDPRLRRRQSRLSSPDTPALKALRKGSVSSESTSLASRHAPYPAKRPSSDVATVERPEQRFKRQHVAGVKPRNDEVLQSSFEKEPNPPIDPRGAAILAAAEGRRLFLQNLPPQTTSAELEKLFSDCEVTDAHVPFKSGRNGSSGCAFVTFATSAAMRRAESTFRGALFYGRRMRIELAREDGRRLSHRGDHVQKRENEPPRGQGARIASRHEAHAAARSDDSTRWSKLGLVSTGGGHQAKEEEL
ncbi:hypothetical protein LTR74_002213 [Friedmanniomyces endolithicus]|nr:hypothetical protein LTR74_002213 [Friedmanniomyces endolithicus]